MQTNLRRALLPFLYFLPLFFLPRIYYVYDNLRQAGFSPWDRNIFLFPIFDIAALGYAFIPAAVFILIFSLPPLVRYRPRVGKFWIIATAFFLTVFSISELFFIQELNSRFNFIAVDYLVYTNEVIRNIWQSYPIVWIMLGLGAIVVPLVLRIFRPLFAYALPPEAGRRAFIFPALVLLISLAAFGLVDESKIIGTRDSVGSEIAKNGLHTLFFAFRHNEINFEKFYYALDGKKATQLMHDEFKQFDGPVAPGETEDPTSIVRNFTFKQPPRKLNVVVVLMESMSARFMGIYGLEDKEKNLTPELDNLARNGLWFNELYASGTRTVRGIEAVMLSIPPTPGQSIVRREGGQGMFNLGSVLQDNGYSLHFVYGGHAPFDNMGAFFAGNGFEIHDEGSFPKEEIHFANAWGVADEDLFAQAIKNADQEAGKQKPFFQFILNTSNHRPYTFPEGRIPAGMRGRDGAVRYSDYAIGKYMEEAKKKPWFKDTLFVFVADHNASVAGGTVILPYDYLIPVIFYSPANLKPEKLSGIAAQLDIAPTILSVLRLPYQSRLWGTSLLERRPGRAFLSTYQKVGLYDGTNLAVLSPKRVIELYKMEGNTPKLVTQGPALPAQEPAFVQRALAYFSAAAYWFDNNYLKAGLRASLNVNKRVE